MKKAIYSPEHQYLAAQLRKARIEAGLDQTKAAKVLKRTQSYISKIEAGQRRIDIFQLNEFARMYKKKLTFFIKNKD